VVDPKEKVLYWRCGYLELLSVSRGFNNIFIAAIAECKSPQQTGRSVVNIRLLSDSRSRQTLRWYKMPTL